MGEAKVRKSATKRLIAEHPNCYFCGGLHPATTRDHMPPVALFDKSHRPAKLVMPACGVCNKGTSTADLAAAVISRWNCDTNLQSSQDHKRLTDQVRRQAPEMLKEWMSVDALGSQEARTHLMDHDVNVPIDAGFALIGPLTVRHVNVFAHKVTIALYFEHFRIPLSGKGGVLASWRSKEDFASQGVPAELLRMFDHYDTLTQRSWSTHQIFEYRFCLNEADGLFGCTARFRDNLFVTGFAVADKATLVGDKTDWVCPAEPALLLVEPRYQNKC